MRQLLNELTIHLLFLLLDDLEKGVNDVIKFNSHAVSFALDV